MINVDELPKRRSSWIRISNVPRARLGWEFSDCADVVPTDIKLVKAWVGKTDTLPRFPSRLHSTLC
jgi:hypothetical protein